MTTSIATRRWEWRPFPNTTLEIRHEPGAGPTVRLLTDGQGSVLDDGDDPMARLDRLAAMVAEARAVMATELEVHQTREAAG